jgi:zinc protease
MILPPESPNHKESLMRARSTLLRLSIFVLLTAVAYGQKPAGEINDGAAKGAIDIPYKKFVLDNGLTVLIHEDHKAPIVAVNVWYHVGSKNEKTGKTGFAHLFEHLMFSGSEHFNEGLFGPMEKAGATDMNGTTQEDRTNYFENVPTSAFDLALWLESDRMGHLLGVVDQKKLDTQRGVVQNEKREGENEPYAVTEELITKNTFPVGHPYSWTVIGSMEDLNAASLNDVHEWFKTYYGAANSILVIAGDVETGSALAKVKHYFDDVPPGPPVAKPQVWIAKRTGSQRGTVQDRVPQARIYKVWNTPQWGTADAAFLRLVGSVLSDGKSSRLYKRLVYDDQIATAVNASTEEREIASVFTIDATAKPAGDLSRVEKAVDEELARFLKDGPTDQELQRAKTRVRSGFIRGIERIGGFGGKSDVLARGEAFRGNPETYKQTLGVVAEATKDNLLRAAREWLSDGVYILEVHPFPEFKASTDTADRSKLPATGHPPEAKFPSLQRATLSNGLMVVLAERQSIPVVQFNLLVNAGYASDQFALPGTASLAMSTLTQGTKRRNALQISDEAAGLGAFLSAGSDLDKSRVSLNALKENLDASLDLFADVILNPTFPQDDFVRQQRQLMARIQQEKVSPFPMALRVLPVLMYGAGHAYGTQFTGSGTEASVAKITRDDLVKFHRAWFKPNNAVLVVVGATSMDAMKPKLEKLFSAWQKGDVQKKNIGTVSLPPKARVYIVDKPGALQSIILAGEIAPPKSDPANIAMETMNTVLGGVFSSRLNMNLREDKHWAYGAGSVILGTEAQRPFIAYAPVQTDKTKESMMEVAKELRWIITDHPATAAELGKAQDFETLTLPGSWETMGAVGGSIGELIRFNLPDDYFALYPARVRALTAGDLTDAAQKVVRPGGLTWVIVGDRAKIEAGVKELNYGELQYIDSDGNPAK